MNPQNSDRDAIPGVRDPFESEMAYAGPAPMNGWAIAGFVCSLVVCCTPVLGVIFSAIGLAQTRGGRYRGRGLAVSGLIISLVIGLPLQGWGGYFLSNVWGTFAKLSFAINDLSDDDVDQAVTRLYPLSSQRLQSQVSQTEMADWIQMRLRELGGIQSVNVNNPQQEALEDRSGLVFSWAAQFPDKSAKIQIKLTMPTIIGTTSVDDILIGDASLLNSISPERNGDEILPDSTPGETPSVTSDDHESADGSVAVDEESP